MKIDRVELLEPGLPEAGYPYNHPYTNPNGKVLVRIISPERNKADSWQRDIKERTYPYLDALLEAVNKERILGRLQKAGGWIGTASLAIVPTVSHIIGFNPLQSEDAVLEFTRYMAIALSYSAGALALEIRGIENDHTAGMILVEVNKRFSQTRILTNPSVVQHQP